MTAASPGAARARSLLHPRDLWEVAGVGLRSRPLRASLSAAGIAIGIAAMVAVLGISASSRAVLLRQLDRLGTNLLTVSPGQTLGGDDASLPETATAMIRRVGPVESASATADVDAAVYRNDRIPSPETAGIAVRAADVELAGTLGASVGRGAFLNEATARYPAVVLGSVAAERLGIDRADGGVQVWLGGRWFSVVGILDPAALAPEVDRSALIGFPVAAEAFGAERSPTTVYVRTHPESVEAVREVLGATANPDNPEEVEVSRPSDALAAWAAASTAFTSLLLGLGGVALLVGGVGIANVMVISVLERRSEIGLRRALGATRAHVRLQFLTESLLLSALGALGGVALGASVTVAYAASRSEPAVIPPLALGGAFAAAVTIGALAGLYPALRAARLLPTEALRSV